MNSLFLFGAIAALFYFLVPPRGSPFRPGGGAIPPPVPSRRLRGSSQIAWIQDSLNKIIGAGLVVDGIKGPKTTEMIGIYQSMGGVPRSGELDAETEAMIHQDLATKGYEY